MYPLLLHFNKCSVTFIILVVCLNMFVQSVDYIFDEEVIIEQMVELNLSITKFGPFIYRKFQAHIFRITTCGLKIHEKAHACSSVLTGPRYNYILSVTGEYFHAPCQPYTVVVNPKSKYFYIRHVPVRAFRCPTAVRIEVTAHKNPIGVDQHRGITYYISGVFQPGSFVMHYEHERYSTHAASQMKPDLLVQNIPQNRFKLVNLLERIKLFEDPTTKPHHPASLPTASRRIKRQSTFILRKPMQAENLVMDFVMRVKNNLLTYSKFTLAYKRVNVCGLSSEQILYACRQCYQNHLFNLLIGYPLRRKPTCQRKEIHFSYDPPPPKLSPIHMYLLECYIRGPKSDNSYYISASRRANTAIMYIQFHPHEEVLPEGKSSLVDADVLKQIGEED